MNVNADFFDYIIVGAGSAGCVLAERLVASADAVGPRLSLGERREPVSLHRWTRFPAKQLAGARWCLNRTGPAATNHFEVGAFIRSTAGVRHPDLQLSFLPLALAPGAVQFDESIGEDGCQLHIDLLRPESRGELALQSADPDEPPRLTFNYLNADTDRLRLALDLTLGAKSSRSRPWPGISAWSSLPAKRYDRARR